MSVSVNFDSIQELETSFRALVLFKFGGSSDADIFAGSPVVARAMFSMLQSIEAYWSSTGQEGRSERWQKLYLMSNAKNNVEAISNYATRHPKWAILTRAERVEWLTVLAAPYELDDAGLGLFKSLLDD